MTDVPIRRGEGNSLVVQWLGLHTFPAKGPGSILGRGTKIPQATQRGKKRRGHREEGEVKMETEVGMMHLQSKERQGLPAPPEVRREAWDGSSLRASRRNQRCGCLDFRLLSS